MYSKLSFSRQVVRLFDAPKKLLLLLSYLLFSRFSINVSEGFRLLLNISEYHVMTRSGKRYLENEVGVAKWRIIRIIW